MDAPLAEKIALLVVAWLFGLLGPAVVDGIRRKRENSLGRVAIVSELRELGSTLALAAYAVRMHQGTVDRAFLEWLKADMEGHATNRKLQEFVPRLRSMLAFSDHQIRDMNSYAAGSPQEGVMLQRYPAPLRDARVAALWSFETSLQRRLLEIRQRLALLDDLIDRSRKYFDLTFTKLEGTNYHLVHENFAQACALYAQGAERLVELIRELDLEQAQR